MSTEPGVLSIGRRKAVLALVVLTAVNIFNYVDRSILSILAESIKADLHLDDAELGFLYGTSFAVFYAIMGMPMGRLADQVHRGRLLSAGLAVWSAMTMLSGLSSNFTQLMIARFFVGAGEATSTPCGQSLLSDYFPGKGRATAIGVHSAGITLGTGLSLYLGGVVAQGWNARCAAGDCLLAGWQVAFLVAGAPGLLLAMLTAMLVEPRIDRGVRRGFAAIRHALAVLLRECATVVPPFTLISLYRIGGWRAVRINLALAVVIGGAATLAITLLGDLVQFASLALGLYALSSWHQAIAIRDPWFFRLTLGSPVYVAALTGSSMTACVNGAVGFWAAPYAIRALGVDMSQAGLLFGGLMAGFATLGVILGGLLCDRLQRRSRVAALYLQMGSLLLPMPMVFVMFLANSLPLFLAGYAVFAFASVMAAGGLVAFVQDLVFGRMRATTCAAYSLCAALIQLAIGPYAAGKVSTATGSLATGVLSIYVLAPIGVAGLVFAIRHAGKALRYRIGAEEAQAG